MIPSRYDSLTRSLHWLMAVMIVAIYAIGIIREELPKGDFRAWLLVLHMSAGLLVVALGCLRVFRRVQMGPLPEIAMPPLMQLAAKAGHGLLYLSLFAVPVIGLFAAWIKGRSLTFFNLFPIPSPVAVDKALGKTLEGVHEVAAHAMLALALAHALAALYHHYILKDGTLARMLGGTAKVAQQQAG